MKALNIFLAIWLISLALSQKLPANGKLEFSVFPGQNCIPGAELPAIIFPVTISNCLTLLDLYSINVLSYVEASNKMTVDVFQTKDCTGNKVSTNIEIGLDGTKCNEGLQLPDIGAVGYKIKLSTISSEGEISLTTYEENDCTTQKATSQTKATDICLSFSATTSFTPLTWNSGSKSISGYSYNGSNTCTPYNSNVSAPANLVCDGTCKAYLTNKAYYKCEYSNSYKLVFSMLSILLVLISLF